MITIGIPTLNGPERLRRALEAIATCTSFERVRVLVCDDGSNPDSLSQNKNLIHEFSGRMPLEMLMNEGRMGIAKSWNHLVKHYPCDVAVLLNDDIEVVDHWLDVLEYSVVENEWVGAVGLNSYVSVIKGDVLRARSMSGLPRHICEPRADYCEARLMDGGGSLLWAPGSVFAFRRDVYDQVGGFDERYFCFYEEADFGVSLRKLNYRSFVAEYPIVYHMGGATTSEGRNVDAHSELMKSRRLFTEKWGKTPAGLRAELVSDNRPKLREWNTHILRAVD